MGLLDSVLGNIAGAAASTQSRSRSTSPVVKALMLLLAAKAYHHYRSHPRDDSSPSEGLSGMPNRGTQLAVARACRADLAVCSRAEVRGTFLAASSAEREWAEGALAVCSINSAGAAMATTWNLGWEWAKTGGLRRTN
jgi:hypothetical protein